MMNSNLGMIRNGNENTMAVWLLFGMLHAVLVVSPHKSKEPEKEMTMAKLDHSSYKKHLGLLSLSLTHTQTNTNTHTLRKVYTNMA